MRRGLRAGREPRPDRGPDAGRDRLRAHGGPVRRDHHRAWPRGAGELRYLPHGPDARSARRRGLRRAEHRCPGGHRRARRPADRARRVQRHLRGDGGPDPQAAHRESHVTAWGVGSGTIRCAPQARCTLSRTTPHSPRFFIDHLAPEAALPRLEGVSLSCSRHDRETRMRDLTRRQLLQHLSLITAGLAVACTPLNLLASAYPQAFDDDSEPTDAVVRALRITLYPSAPAD